RHDGRGAALVAGVGAVVGGAGGGRAPVQRTAPAALRAAGVAATAAGRRLRRRRGAGGGLRTGLDKGVHLFSVLTSGVPGNGSRMPFSRNTRSAPAACSG